MSLSTITDDHLFLTGFRQHQFRDMINATSTFVDDSDHKIVEADSILQKFYKRAIASVNEFTYINTVKAVADEVLFNRVLMSLGVERCNNSSNCLGDTFCLSRLVVSKTR